LGLIDLHIHNVVGGLVAIFTLMEEPSSKEMVWSRSITDCLLEVEENETKVLFYIKRGDNLEGRASVGTLRKFRATRLVKRFNINKL
jgi:hypothetical protein